MSKSLVYLLLGVFSAIGGLIATMIFGSGDLGIASAIGGIIGAIIGGWVLFKLNKRF